MLKPERAKYSGRKNTLTRSSSFSVSLMANPPSWGQTNPIRKAPKIGWTPITPVKKAEAKTISTVRATTDCVGPL